jgi:hypothetical protein
LAKDINDKREDINNKMKGINNKMKNINNKMKEAFHEHDTECKDLMCWKRLKWRELKLDIDDSKAGCAALGVLLDREEHPTLQTSSSSDTAQLVVLVSSELCTWWSMYESPLLST